MSPMVEAQFEECVDRLYGVLADPGSFNRALGSFADLFGATGVSFLRTNAAGELVSMDDYGRDRALVSRFVEHYADMDPTRPTLVSSRPGIWLNADRLLDPRHTPQPEYVNDFAIDAGMRWFRGGKVEEGAYGAAFFSVHRPSDAKPFDDAVFRLLDSLKPHLARVARLLIEQQVSGVSQSAPAALMDTLSTGVCVVDARLNVAYANRSALVMLGDAGPLCIRANGLAGTTTSIHAQLRQSVGLATKPPRQARSFSPNPDDVLPRRLQVRVLPLDEQAELARASGGPFALLFIARGTSPLRSDELVQLFGLTPSEAGLVRLLSQGLTPAICADRRRIGIATVRTQLSSIYAKTGVTSLAQLMSLVTALPGLVGS